MPRAERTRSGVGVGPCWLAPVLPLVLAACRTTLTLVEFDDLARTNAARTIVLEPDISLYSPYDLVRTRAYLEVLRAQRDEVFALFGVARERPLVVQLRPNPSLGVELSLQDGGVRVDGFSDVTSERIGGQATLDLVIIEVDPERVLELPDGRSLPGAFEPSMYADTIRHELTHVATWLLGIKRSDWLSEGIAHAVDSIPLENGRFDLDPVPETLRETARLPHDAQALERMLAWRQGFPVTDADVTARRLATSLVVFVLERDGSPDLRQGLLGLSAMDRPAILALHSEWSAWLDRLALP